VTATSGMTLSVMPTSLPGKPLTAPELSVGMTAIARTLTSQSPAVISALAVAGARVAKRVIERELQRRGWLLGDGSRLVRSPRPELDRAQKREFG